MQATKLPTCVFHKLVIQAFKLPSPIATASASSTAVGIQPWPTSSRCGWFSCIYVGWLCTAQQAAIWQPLLVLLLLLAAMGCWWPSCRQLECCRGAFAAAATPVQGLCDAVASSWCRVLQHSMVQPRRTQKMRCAS